VFSGQKILRDLVYWNVELTGLSFGLKVCRAGLVPP